MKTEILLCIRHLLPTVQKQEQVQEVQYMLICTKFYISVNQSNDEISIHCQFGLLNLPLRKLLHQHSDFSYC